MPQLGGLQVIRLLRELHQATPAILLTNHLTSHLLHEALGMQVFSVLSKPVDFNVLLDALARVLRRYHESRWPGESPEKAQQAKEQIDISNLKSEISNFLTYFFQGVQLWPSFVLSETRSSSSASRRETKTKSGIVLPDTAKEKPKRGKVLSVGEGKRLDTGERAPVNVKKGDEVIFASYAGTEIKLDGEELMIMSDDDVLAVVE